MFHVLVSREEIVPKNASSYLPTYHKCNSLQIFILKIFLALLNI